MAELEVEEIKNDEKKPRKWIAYILIGVIILIVLVLLFLGYLYVEKSGLLDKVFSGNTKNESVENREVAIGQLFSFEEFVVNLADPSGSRYLRMGIDVEVDNKNVIVELKERKPQLRDIIISIASSKTFEDIQSVRGKIALKSEIKRRVNLVLNTGKIKNVYFTQFVVQ
ncbi:MAG: flagellar basal body-associated FliL family protein [Deferribacterota bacterium]|nr:flagellar basal body-associated FliL family protein [Deferribacterota bacterium]